MSAADAPSEQTSVQESLEELWYLKDITFRPEPDSPPKPFKIITQNLNGSVPSPQSRPRTLFTALQAVLVHRYMCVLPLCRRRSQRDRLTDGPAGNILILRGHIQVLPPERTTVTYDLLARLVSEYLLAACPDVDTSAALSIMPVTRSTCHRALATRAFFSTHLALSQEGMDLNPLFTGATSFRPAGTGGELKLFEQAGVQLVHGWLADPDSPEYEVLARTEDYDTSVNLLVEADHLTKGQLVSSSGAAPPRDAAGSGADALTSEERQKVEDGKSCTHVPRIRRSLD